MSEERKEEEEPAEKCICGKEGCNLECDPISFEDDCFEPSCHV